MKAAAVAGLALLLGLGVVPAQAGHGLMNAFSDIAWLPDPGRTPDQADYALDALAERARLALADTDERLALRLDYAREKLAEVDAMVAAEKPGPANVAIDAWLAHVDAATAEIDALAPKARAAAAGRLANALLEHQYLMSIGYLDLPRDTRTVIGRVMAAARAHYDTLVAGLPQAFKDAQFFKEEEVRWSWEMATRGDA
ncbi:MAG: hypothetical protein KDK06_15515, partial [Gammaproteobacteria bacterium]|nr:hypothetical protein [Gammaproteobacteria bacterium]